MKRKYMSKNVNFRDLLERADKTLYKKRPNVSSSSFYLRKKNARYNLRNASVSVPRIHTDRFNFSNRVIFKYDM